MRLFKVFAIILTAGWLVVSDASDNIFPPSFEYLLKDTVLSEDKSGEVFIHGALVASPCLLSDFYLSSGMKDKSNKLILFFSECGLGKQKGIAGVTKIKPFNVKFQWDNDKVSTLWLYNSENQVVLNNVIKDKSIYSVGLFYE